MRLADCTLIVVYSYAPLSRMLMHAMRMSMYAYVMRVADCTLIVVD